MARENTSSQRFNEKTEDIEILDVENYRGDKQLIFNHQTLVMEILRKSSEAGSHELRAGWTNEKVDNQGNIVRTYIEDTRKKFIETVRTAMAVMSCDFDTTAKENVDNIIDSLEELREDLLKQQWEWFLSLNPRMKSNYEGRISPVFFNMDLGWYLKLIEEETEVYREILEELHALTKRLDFYQIEDLEG